MENYEGESICPETIVRKNTRTKKIKESRVNPAGMTVTERIKSNAESGVEDAETTPDPL